MIKDHCFTDEWLEGFKKQNDHRRIDKIILEKMIYALHLLERLKSNGLHFVFKGGTSLVLLLETGSRFSIDIDIMCKIDRKELEEILQQVVDSSHFTGFDWTNIVATNPEYPKHTISSNLLLADKGQAPYSWMFSSRIRSILS